MEIERKFLIHTLPDRLESYPHDTIRQAYISTDPVIRIRQKNDSYILTVKSSGLLAREETELPLSADSFAHLMTKTEGTVIEKVRYQLPEKDGLIIELDIFSGVYKGFIMAEVEFSSIEQAQSYQPPSWFGRDVTNDVAFHNSNLSRRSSVEIQEFLQNL